MARRKIRYLKPFEPLEWQLEPWRDTSPVLLLTGSAGGGKSRVAAEKLHAYCMKYPGTTALALRKVRASMANSTVLFFKKEIIGRDPRVTHRASEFRFDYENGSILAYGGMKDDDQRERIRSIGQKGGLDIAWMEEATEFEEEDYNELAARMRGIAADWRQVILTTNPEGPGHWINRRLILGGEASVYYSRAQDNPNNPKSYLHTLETLTGVQRFRLLEGRWVAGSNLVFDTWRDNYQNNEHGPVNGNVRLDADYIPDGGDLVWAVDDGYSGKYDEKTGLYTGRSHPRVFLIVQRRSDGVAAVVAESYAIETLADEHIAKVLQLHDKHNWPRPAYVVRDRAAASLGGAIQRYGLRVKYNQVPVDESIKEMHRWISPDHNNWRRIVVHPRCRLLRYEMATYAYDKNNRVIKEHDNASDALRYFVWDEVHGVNPAIDIATMDTVADRTWRDYLTTERDRNRNGIDIAVVR